MLRGSSMWFCTLKLDKEKWKHVGLAQQNGFGPTFLGGFAEAGSQCFFLPETNNL